MSKKRDRYENDGSDLAAMVFIALVSLILGAIFWLRLTDGSMS